MTLGRCLPAMFPPGPTVSFGDCTCLRERASLRKRTRTVRLEVALTPHRPRRPLRPSPRPAASTFLTWLGYVLVGPPLTAKARDSHVVWFCFGCFFFGFGLFLVVSFFGFAYKPNCNFPVPKSLSSWPVASERCPNS